jgi:hypothetical protein
MAGTFQGAGTLQFTPDNKHAFAYSGNISVTGASSANTNILEFDTQSYYLITTFQPFSTNRGSAQLYLEIKLDDETVVKTEFDSSGSVNPLLDVPIKLIIPPFTNFKTFVGIESGSSTNWSAVLTSKVKGSIEQFNLEVKE